MVKQVITFSDGSETVLDYRKNDDADEIEAESAAMVAANRTPEEVPAAPVEEETISSTSETE